jgi:hypothetical protein
MKFSLELWSQGECSPLRTSPRVKTLYCSEKHRVLTPRGQTSPLGANSSWKTGLWMTTDCIVETMQVDLFAFRSELPYLLSLYMIKFTRCDHVRYFKKGCPGRAGERTRDLLISFSFSLYHFTAEPRSKGVFSNRTWFFPKHDSRSETCKKFSAIEYIECTYIREDQVKNFLSYLQVTSCMLQVRYILQVTSVEPILSSAENGFLDVKLNLYVVMYTCPFLVLSVNTTLNILTCNCMDSKMTLGVNDAIGIFGKKLLFLAEIWKS